MALSDRFAEYHAQASATAGCLQRSPVKNLAESVNRKLVQELANRPSVIEALREERSVSGRFGRQQERANGSMKSRLGFRNKYRNLSVHDRLGYVTERRMFHHRHFGSGVSPLIRDQLRLQELNFEKKRQLNQEENFYEKDNFEEKQQSSSKDIYIKVDINESEPKTDMDDVHFKVECRQNQPRAYPTGIFNFHHGIRYYGPEIFIWITESDPINEF